MHVCLAGVMRGLLAALRELWAPLSEAQNTRDFRRAHARVMAVCGSPLSRRFRAGVMRSGAIPSYVKEKTVEEGAVREARSRASSSDDGAG